MATRENEAYVDNLMGALLWNELFTGQTMDSLRRLSRSMGILFDESMINRCRLVASGMERNAYRQYGVSAIDYPRIADEAWEKLSPRLSRMGFRARYAMNFYHDKKLLIYILVPEKGAKPVKEAAQAIHETLQTAFEENFLGNDKQNGNFTVYDEEPLTGAGEVSSAFARLSELHELVFFPLEERVLDQKRVDGMRLECGVDALLQSVRDLAGCIRQRDLASAKRIFDAQIVQKLNQSLDRRLCCRTMEALFNRLLEIDCIFDIDVRELKELDIEKYTCLEALSRDMWALVKRQIALLSATNRRYCHLTRAAILYLKQNYKSEITLSALASRLDVAPAYLSRVFNRDMGMSIPRYVLTLKLDEARLLLRDGSLGISRVAARCAFQNASYFCKLFKREFGVTPGEYRDSLGPEIPTLPLPHIVSPKRLTT